VPSASVEEAATSTMGLFRLIYAYWSDHRITQLLKCVKVILEKCETRQGLSPSTHPSYSLEVR